MAAGIEMIEEKLRWIAEEMEYSNRQLRRILKKMRRGEEVRLGDFVHAAERAIHIAKTAERIIREAPRDARLVPLVRRLREAAEEHLRLKNELCEVLRKIFEEGGEA